jgi:hypothetical protein
MLNYGVKSEINSLEKLVIHRGIINLNTNVGATIKLAQGQMQSLQ